VEHNLHIHPPAVVAGDAVLVSGDLGRHGVAILAARDHLGFRTTLRSDLASLLPPVQALLAAGLELHCLRDLTRGGLASAIDEIATSAGCAMELYEPAIPVGAEVSGACQLLGLDPLTMANEGRMVVVLPQSQAETALTLLRQVESSAAQIGTVQAVAGPSKRWPVQLRSELGVLRPLDVGQGEQLPRIC
jgi:hydrogenase expression/formation protein HypE